MSRGRKRLLNPGIPKHIDQQALPRGIYWDQGRWFVYEDHPEGGRRTKRTVAYGSARLSELHALVEMLRGGDQPGTLDYVVRAFKLSSEYKGLSKSTRDDYERHSNLACAYVLKDGGKLGTMVVDRMSVPTIQRLVETLALGREAGVRQPALPPRPSTANHVLRYLRRLFAWGIRHGKCKTNPASGVRAAKEVGAFHMPEPDAFRAVLKFARQRARLPLHAKGAVPPYMPAIMLIAYHGRLRGIEVTELTDIHQQQEGLLCERRKGSLDSITPWNRDLRWAWAWLQRYRTARMEAHRRPVPMKADARRLLVTQTGTPLARSTLKTAWQRLILAAIDTGVIAAEDRFNLHGLKHRGITDTPGTRAVKRDGAGHVNPAMTIRYDHDVPVVVAPRLPRRKPPGGTQGQR